ncbi:hypothetical protein VTN77DRAFT_6580 [Rasamsonia byssochlamydoides]|uniref:uncharacterized protein n=1 Tax=Rasamsonia byssochlamydoides TaxID=89139 RepID=UPI003743E0EC
MASRGIARADTLTSISNLGIVLENQGKYQEAEKMYRQALEGREKVLGPEHPDTVRSVDRLASVLKRLSMKERGRDDALTSEGNDVRDTEGLS